MNKKVIVFIFGFILFSNTILAQEIEPKIEDYYGVWILDNITNDWCTLETKDKIKKIISQDKYIFEKEGHKTIVEDPVYIYHEKCFDKWWYCEKVFFVFSPDDIGTRIKNDDFRSVIELSDDYKNVIWGRSDGKCNMRKE
ncbi:MAG: hypothetical protein LBU68_00650 [Rickettsiales bacterium]|nr:hypothetical protein [Rickettsiales bacterium]